MKKSHTRVVLAEIRLRAYGPTPAAVRLVYRPLPGRILRTVLSLVLFWGAIPVLVWVPPHVPWVVGAFLAGAYLSYRSWTGRYRVYCFAGICPRCGHSIALGVEREVSLPCTLTCFHCHFEPELVVEFADGATWEEPSARLEHGTSSCCGDWEVRWLADEPFLVCDRCYAGAPATPEAREQAEAERERASLLQELTRQGRGLL